MESGGIVALVAIPVLVLGGALITILIVVSIKCKHPAFLNLVKKIKNMLIFNGVI